MADSVTPTDPRPSGRRVALVSLAILLVALPIAVWLLRHPIATHFVDRELRRRGVDARYRITTIGFGRQVLEDVSIGPRDRPDLTAGRVVVHTRVGLSGVGVSGIEASGVRLRAAVVGGRLRLGQVDRLLPPPSGKPFSLPDLPLLLADTQVALRTPVGAIWLRLEGNGNLARHFTGRVAVTSDRVRAGGCVVDGLDGRFAAEVTAGRPTLSGPARVTVVNCGPRFRAATVIGTPNVTLSSSFDRIQGTVPMSVARVTSGGVAADALSGRLRLAGTVRAFRGRADLSVGRAGDGVTVARDAGAQVTFAGSPDALSGTAVLTTARLASGGHRARNVSARAAYAVRLTNGMSAELRGEASAGAVQLAPAALARLDDLDSGLNGTPLSAIAARIGEAAQRAGTGFALAGSWRAAVRGGAIDATISSARLRSASGVVSTLNGRGGDGEGLRIGIGRGRTPTLDGVLRVAGGGLPTGEVRLTRDARGAMTGLARLQPYVAGSSRIALAPVRFSAGADGRTRIDTAVVLSGPFAGGRIDGASTPVSAVFDRTGKVVVNPGCTAARFERLAISGVVFDATPLRLCAHVGTALFQRSRSGAVQAGATIAQPRLVGRLGQTPVTLAADTATVELRRGEFAVTDLRARIGAPEAVTRLDFDSLTGGFLGQGGQGAFTGASGQVGAVPILWSRGAGEWAFKNGRLSLNGDLTVDDAADPERFQTLSAPGFGLRFAGSVIDAAGPLIDPESGRAVAQVTIHHSFSEGGGEATLQVRDLAFDDALQPSRLTPLALGVVADVQGRVNGDARIAWDGTAVTSTGTFATSDMSLAAAFGPVTGLSTTVRFTDLLNLVTADDQLLTVDRLNPGVPVDDGVVRYAIVPGRRIAIRSGRWPFAGGTLSLEPTTLEFGEGKRQDFVLDVIALDAAVLLDTFEFDNIAATGVFDGQFPLSFTNGNGEVVGGHLDSRQPGGTVAYVGAVSQEDLGFFGNLAFDALKSLKYDKLDIRLNGPLSGQMVTALQFDGLAQGVGARRNILTRAIAGLPFVFKITITAPFRQLLFSARSFSDPELLVEQNLGLLYREQQRNEPVEPTKAPSVQDQESEPSA